MEIRFEYLYFGVFIAGILALLIGWLLTLRKPASWEAYEEHVAKVLSNEGWERVKLGAKRSDGGRDVMGYKDKQKRIVQCKFYKKPVGVAIIRETCGVGVHYKARAMVCTTCGFTEDATRYASATGVVLRIIQI